MKPSRFWIATSATIAVLLLVGYGAAHVLSEDPEVRISARRLDDGRTEFALQQRTDGQWGERILPRSRMFPASPRDGRWLNSSPLTIATEPAEIVREVGEETYAGGRIGTSVISHSPFGARGSTIISTVSIRPDQSHNDQRVNLELALRCRGGSGWLDIQLVGFSSDMAGDVDIQYSLEPTPDDGRAISIEQWPLQRNWDISDRVEFAARAQFTTRLYHWLKQANTFSMIVFREGEDLELTFNLEGVWETPVQPNLDQCGHYY